MAASKPHVFKNVTPEKYQLLIEKARGAGIEMKGNSGSASKFGVEIAWNYAPESQELTLQCMKAPFFMSATEVDSKIQSLVGQTLA